MKKFAANYILYVYLHFIKNDDIEIYKNWAKPIMKFTNFISSIYIWIGSIIFFPFFLIGMKFEKDYLKIINIFNKY